LHLGLAKGPLFMLGQRGSAVMEAKNFCNKDKVRLDTLQAGRALAALSVLLFHTNITLSLPKYLGVDTLPVTNIGYSGVHFFFVLSGFVIYLAHHNDIGIPSRIPRYLWKRFCRIYPPLWVVLLIVIPVFFLIPTFGKGTETSPLNISLSFFVLPSLDDNILSVEWTLRHEIIFYAIFTLIILKRSLGLAIFIVWCALSSIQWSNNFLGIFFFSPYHVLFAMGMLSAVAYRKGITTAPAAFTPAALLVLGFVAFAGTWVVCSMAGYRGPGPHASPLSEWFFGLGAALILYGAATLERRGRLSVPRPIVFLGEASYSIYLVHYVAISAASKVINHAALYIPGILIFIFVALTALLAGVAFNILVERPILSILSSRVGRIALSRG
jgi:peptidoglycan/LPS O-acetylase OafA/YrhL